MECAIVVHELFSDRLAYLGKPGWYAFMSPSWHRVGHDTDRLFRTLERFIETHKQTHESLLGEVELSDDDRLFTQNDLAGLEKISYLVRDPDMKIEVLAHIQTLFEISDPDSWMDKMDSGGDVIGLEDCVYDFREKRFREGRPDDMVSMSVGHSREGVEGLPPDVRKEVVSAIKVIHKNEDEFNYVLCSLATSVSGRGPIGTFSLWTGHGTNCLTTNITKAAFGAYYGSPKIDELRRRKCAEGHMKGKRVLISSSAEPNAFIRPASVFYDTQGRTGLPATFTPKQYGAAFLSILIDTFNENGFDFGVPQGGLDRFVRKTYDHTGNPDDFVSGIEIWNAMLSDRVAREQLGIASKQEMLRQLRVYGYITVTRKGAVVILGLKTKREHGSVVGDARDTLNRRDTEHISTPEDVDILTKTKKRRIE